MLVRGRRDVRGRVARGHQLRRDPQAPRHLRLREQPLRDLGPRDEADGGRERRRSRRGVRHPRRHRRWQRRPRLLRGDEERGRAREGGRRPDADRGEDVPLLPTHLRRRRPFVSIARGGRGGEAPGSGPSVRARAARPRRADRRRHRARRRGDQGGHRRADRSRGERGRSRPRNARAASVRRGRLGVTEKNVVTAIHDALHDEMAADDRLVVLGEDIAVRGGVFRVTQGFLDEFGEGRVIDTPLAEGGIIGVAVGMALHGLIPVAEIEFADFIHPAFDQMVSEVSKMRYRTNGDFGLPMVIRAPYGGGVHGALYHSQSIEALYGHIPGIKVVVPSTPADAAGMLRAAIADPDPVLFLEHKRTYRLIKGDVPDERFEVPIGEADVKREGDDLTVIAYGLMLHQSLEAAARLEQEEGVSVEVVDVRTISPLDRETIITSVRKTGKAMVVYEDNRTYGAGAEIVATIAEEAMFDLDAPLVRIGGPDVPAMGFATNLEHAFMPDTDRIHAAMLELARF